MAKHINITDRLEAAKPRLYFSEGEVYEINDDKNAVLKVQQLLANSEDEMEDVDKVFELLLGEEAIKEIKAKHEGVMTRISQIRVVLIAIMAAINAEDYDTVEARFRSDE